jgi:tetratricopeptide (TPR) repeat protein
VEVVTGLTLDKQGLIQVLDNAAWRARRARLNELGGPPRTGIEQRVDAIPFGPNPTARGYVLMERGQWDAAETAFDEVVGARPNAQWAWNERGRFHLARKQWGKAAADFAQEARIGPDRVSQQYLSILTLLASGDGAGFRRACSRLLDRIGTTTNWPGDGNEVAWCLVLGPDAVADRDAPVRLAVSAVNSNDDERHRANYLNTLGAALYRAGRFEEAIRRLEEGIRKRGGEGLPQDWVFLALSHYRLGHRAESRRWLDRLRDRQPREDLSSMVVELEIRLLRSEAEAVILYDPMFPADPFAH